MHRLLTLLLAIFSLQAFSTSGFCSSAPALELRFASLSGSRWMDAKQAPDVRREIDRIIADGYNAVSLGAFRFVPMYFIDYTKTPYPEAQQYTPAQSKSQLDTLRANLGYAKSKGIKIAVTRSYSNFCPRNFWLAHQPELNPGGIFNRFLEIAHMNDAYLDSKKGKPDGTVPYGQWENPVYRNFFLYSTERMLDLIPELDGFYNAYAEAAWTIRADVLKKDEWKNWKDAINYEASETALVDYVNSLHDLLLKKRGTRGFLCLRDWYVKPATLARFKMPPSQLYIAVKFAGSDQPLVNYPPWGKDLLDLGYGIIIDIIIYDAEHPHPVYCYSNDIIEKILANLRAANFPAVSYQDYQLKAKNGDSLDHPIRLLTQKTFAAALADKPFTDADAIAFLKPYYGDGAAPLFRSLKDVAQAQEAFIKLNPAWFWHGDGLTAGGLGGRRLWMLKDDPEAPPGMSFVRQDAMSIADYVAQSVAQTAKSADEAKPRPIENPKSKIQNFTTPPQIIALMRRLADDALAAALEFRAKAPRNAPYLRDLVASAFIHQQLVARDTAFLEAAIHFARAGSTWDGKFNNDRSAPRPAPGVDPAAEKTATIEALQRMIYHEKIMHELLAHYAPRRPTLRGGAGYSNEKTMAKILDATPVEPPLDTAEYKRIEQQILAK